MSGLSSLASPREFDRWLREGVGSPKSLTLANDFLPRLLPPSKDDFVPPYPDIKLEFLKKLHMKEEIDTLES